MISLRSICRLQVGQNCGWRMRERHTLWSWLRLMRSVRAAAKSRMGIDTRPKVRWPFHTEVAMKTPPAANQPLAQSGSETVRLRRANGECKAKNWRRSVKCHSCLPCRADEREMIRATAVDSL